MKCLFFFFAFLLLANTSSFAQVYGPAILFDYDAVGNRILRHHDPHNQLDLYRMGDTTNTPIDTLNESFGDDMLMAIKAYPNPVENYLIIDNLSWNNIDKASAKIFDITGKYIMSKEMDHPKDQLDFRNIIPGTYQVHYYINNKFVTMWKIVKH